MSTKQKKIPIKNLEDGESDDGNYINGTYQRSGVEIGSQMKGSIARIIKDLNRKRKFESIKKYGYMSKQNLIPPYCVPLGHQDWHYLTDKNFTCVRVYLDLIQVSREGEFFDDMQSVMLQESDMSSQKSNGNKNIFEKGATGMMNMGRKVMKSTTGYDYSKKKEETKVIQIDKSPFNYVDLILSRNNMYEIGILEHIQTKGFPNYLKEIDQEFENEIKGVNIDFQALDELDFNDLNIQIGQLDKSITEKNDDEPNIVKGYLVKDVVNHMLKDKIINASMLKIENHIRNLECQGKLKDFSDLDKLPEMHIYCVNIRQNQPFFMDDIEPDFYRQMNQLDERLDNAMKPLNNYFIRMLDHDESLQQVEIQNKNFEILWVKKYRERINAVRRIIEILKNNNNDLNSQINLDYFTMEKLEKDIDEQIEIIEYEMAKVKYVPTDKVQLNKKDSFVKGKESALPKFKFILASEFGINFILRNLRKKDLDFFIELKDEQDVIKKKLELQKQIVKILEFGLSISRTDKKKAKLKPLTGKQDKIHKLEVKIQSIEFENKAFMLTNNPCTHDEDNYTKTEGTSIENLQHIVLYDEMADNLIRLFNTVGMQTNHIRHTQIICIKKNNQNKTRYIIIALENNVYSKLIYYKTLSSLSTHQYHKIKDSKTRGIGFFFNKKHKKVFFVYKTFDLDPLKWQDPQSKGRQMKLKLKVKVKTEQSKKNEQVLQFSQQSQELKPGIFMQKDLFEHEDKQITIEFKNDDEAQFWNDILILKRQSNTTSFKMYQIATEMQKNEKQKTDHDDKCAQSHPKQSILKPYSCQTRKQNIFENMRKNQKYSKYYKQPPNPLDQSWTEAINPLKV